MKLWVYTNTNFHQLWEGAGGGSFLEFVVNNKYLEIIFNK